MVRFVISITTLPDRFVHIKPVIKSILKHNENDIDKLYICLPYGNVSQKTIDKVIPRNSNVVKLIRCRDYGPITKIAGVLNYEKDPDTLILTLDDDTIITDNIVKIFKRKAKKYPHACLSMSGWCYGNAPFMYQIVIANDKDVKVDWIQGVHGILYRRKFINKKELLGFMRKDKLLFKNDDHKIAAYLESKNVKRISLNYNPVNYFKNYIPSSSVNPISGGNSFYDSILFWNNVKTISDKFNKKKYYRHNYDSSKSPIFLAILSLLLLIFVVFAGYYVKCNYDMNGWIILLFGILLIFCIVFPVAYYYKHNYFLHTTK